MSSNVNHVLLFLVDTLCTLYAMVLLVRVLLQVTHAPFHNPVSQFVWRITARPVAWLSMGIPRWRNVDIPAITLAILLCFINLELDIFLQSLDLGSQPARVAGYAVLKTFILLCDLYFFTILVDALLSWLSPSQYSPATAVLRTLNEPLLKPVRKRLPPIAGLDLSPLVILIGLQVVSMLIQLPLPLR